LEDGWRIYEVLLKNGRCMVGGWLKNGWIKGERLMEDGKRIVREWLNDGSRRLKMVDV
jgi:hypothetical protein